LHQPKPITVSGFSGKNSGEKLNIEKFGSSVGKSVILWELIQN
jgi:hypothetical protein